MFKLISRRGGKVPLIRGPRPMGKGNPRARAQAQGRECVQVESAVQLQARQAHALELADRDKLAQLALLTRKML